MWPIYFSNSGVQVFVLPNLISKFLHHNEAIADKMDSLILIKQQELKYWEAMIAGKKKEYTILEILCRNVKLGVHNNSSRSTTQTSTPPATYCMPTTYKDKEGSLVSKYTLADLHLNDKQTSRVHIRKKDK